MYAGRIVESGRVDDVFARPSHGYTQGLLASTPRIDETLPQRLRPIEGQPPDMTIPQTLCPFLPRCAISLPACTIAAPISRDFGAGHRATCLA